MEYAALGIGVLNLVFVIIILIKVLAKKSDSGEQVLSALQLTAKATGDEFARSRTEINAAINQINSQIANLKTQNLEHQNKMLETVVANLKDINNASLEQNNRIQLAMSSSVQKMQESNEKKLEEMRQTVDEKLTSTIKDRLDITFKDVSKNLENVYKSLGEMKELAGGVSDLQRVLTNVKARGTWAEVQLGNILEQTLTTEQYATNVSIKNDGKFVEFAVKIPSKDDSSQIVWLPIDSKFPQEDYINLSEAAERADKEAVDKYSKELEKRIISEAIAIKNSYIDVPKTTDFGIMFLPTEGLYAEILRRPGLVEKIQNEQRIMICGPTTITAFLNTLKMGFRTIALDKRAAEVWRVLGAAKTQYDKFGEILEKAKKKVDEASSALDLAQNRNTQIKKRLKNVETLDQDESLALLEVDGFDV